MWKVAEAVVLIGLGAAAIWDVRKRCVPAAGLLAGTIAVIAFQIGFGKTEWYLCAFGALCGGMFLLISRYSDEEIGYGDSWMIFNLGMFLGLWRLMAVLLLAFLGAAVAAVCGVAGGKWNRKTTIPFLPFLLAGYVGVLLW